MMLPRVDTERQTAINLAVGELDRWLDTMRGSQGYTGPDAYWWQQRFIWKGTAFDWRYEGIIAGYVQLWRATGDGQWLAKAQWAGDDLLGGQSPGGHFEPEPSLVGVAQEAMCATALLDLALALREAGGDVWQPYAAAGELTIHGALIGNLWDSERRIFRDSANADVFLPHRIAAICEALFRQAELHRTVDIVENYALPSLRTIVEQQIVLPNSSLDGAIPYRIVNSQRSQRFLPLCVVRCVPALLQGFDWTGDPVFLQAAWRAFAFVQRWRNADGSFPAIVYANGRCNQYPHWIAATGDVLRAAKWLERHGISTNTEPTLRWVIAGQDATGGIQTARGFLARAWRLPERLPDLRDLLHVVGWCDKAFRALALEATEPVTAAGAHSYEQRCTFYGRLCTFAEDDSRVEISIGREVRYRWRKGDAWPTICAPEFITK